MIEAEIQYGWYARCYIPTSVIQNTIIHKTQKVQTIAIAGKDMHITQLKHII
jgi:hypothetical protein